MKRFALILLFLPLITHSQAFQLIDSSFHVGDKYITHSILFDYNKSTLRPDSYIFLDSIVDFLKKNKGLVIEVSNHRDTRGSSQLSREITGSRARSISSYLISKGIDSARITARGYGEHAPIIPESVIHTLKNKEEIEKAHQKNRRTELKILRLDYEQ